MDVNDSLVNLVSGMGTARDKGAAAKYVLPHDDPAQLYAAYKASAIVRRAVDLPAEDACRDWREWQAEADQISALEAEEDRLGVRAKVYAARHLARLYGGAAIIIGTGDADPSQPLEPGTVKKGGLRYLSVLSSIDMAAGQIENDPTKPEFGLPLYWTIGGNAVKMHPSRVVIFHGIPPMSGIGFEARNGWGDSVLTGMLEPLRRVDETAANVNALVYEAKVDVISIPNFMQNLAQRGPAYSAEVLKRLTLAATGKGISGALIKDTEEGYDQKSASFSGLPEILDRQMQLASAHAGIPMTLLFGMSPGGMNATGESDVRSYYDRVKVQQTLHMSPAMHVMDECLIMSAIGTRPPELHYTWRPLWQPTAKERAENADKLMTAIEKLHNMGVVSPEATGKAAVNGLTESGAFPGLEGYVAEFGAGDDEGGDL